VRPLKLVLENFASYRGAPVELDFAALELFAIAGPTGAGKSTLLDAIFFALYGYVPRLGRRANEMISLGADRMSVLFDFRVGVESYRVSRQARRRRNAAATAQLERIGSDGAGHPLRDGVREVNSEIERILGLSYEAFAQAVILPQGEFQKFLKSEPRERREILSRILRLEIYEQMRRLASDRARTLDQTTAELKRRLSEDYGEATPEVLQAVQQRAAVLGERIERLAQRQREAEAWRELTRTMRAKTRELEQHRARNAELQVGEAQICSEEARLEGARRAAPIIPQVEIAQATERRTADARRACDEAAASHSKAEAVHGQARSRAAEAATAAEELPVLDDRIARLDRLLGRMQPRPRLAAELAEVRKARLAAADDLKNAHVALLRREHDLTRAQTRLHEEDRRFARVSYDRALFELLDGVREDISQLFGLSRDADAVALEIRAVEARLEAKQQALVRQNVAAERAQAEAMRAAEDLSALQQQEVEARHLASAALLRQQLRLGDLCPVCEHPVDAHPPPLATPVLDTLLQRLTQARRAESKARQAADQARTMAAEARATEAAERESLGQSRRHGEKAVAGLTRARAALAEKLTGHLSIGTDQFVEQQAQEAYRAAAEAKSKNEAARVAREAADSALRQSEQAREQAQATAEGRQARLEQLDERSTALSRQIAEIDEDIRKVTSAPDPAAERAALYRRRADIESARHASREAAAQAESTLAAALARRHAAAQALKQALADAKRQHAAARAAIAAAGFPDEAAVVAAALDPSAQRHIEDQVRAFRQEQAVVAERIKALTRELGGNEVPQDMLEAAEQDAVAAREALSVAERESATVGQRIRELSEAIGRAAALQAELESRIADLALYHSLAHDLRSDRFQAFLLEETFGELVAGASERLWELTRRYRFGWQDETFYVLDHDNARQMRSADTLSGGETFLASLALALQLTDQVQKAAGATPLDSLFIDEGFGTLDQETLDAAAGAIENLPIGGRMIGIITHIEELSLRLPARVRVGKTGGGSRLTLEAG
jgi:exonuclease SbcC